NDPHTLRLLEILAKHDVQATFFLIGRYVQQRPDIVRELVRAGHAVGNHTFSHPLLTFKSGAKVRNELETCHHVLTEAVGEHSNLFRPPFGGRRPAVLRIARELGFEPVMWNVTGYDWNAPSVEHIERKVVRKVHGGDVILLHDGGHLQMGADRSRTVTATDRLIGRYKAKGYEFLTIPEMMERGRAQPMAAVPASLYISNGKKPAAGFFARTAKSPAAASSRCCGKSLLGGCRGALNVFFRVRRTQKGCLVLRGWQINPV